MTLDVPLHRVSTGIYPKREIYGREKRETGFRTYVQFLVARRAEAHALDSGRTEPDICLGR